ncbi:unnamed protein product, partial [Rotaria socialis]
MNNSSHRLTRFVYLGDVTPTWNDTIAACPAGFNP